MKPRLLLLTNPSNESPEEDAFIEQELGDSFEVAVRHPSQCADKEDEADLILIRNSWPISEYRDVWEATRRRFSGKRLRTYNDFSGRGDMQGKRYLVDLAREGFPVIPTADTVQGARAFGADEYIAKPIFGGSGVGVQKIDAAGLQQLDFGTHILQPFIDFEYEVSFYYIDNEFRHALYAPEKAERWDLRPYDPSPDDIDFAESFVRWNTLRYGIERVDACRTRDGRLLLMELEDFCPYLSLLDIDSQIRERFLRTFVDSLFHALQ